MAYISPGPVVDPLRRVRNLEIKITEPTMDVWLIAKDPREPLVQWSPKAGRG